VQQFDTPQLEGTSMSRNIYLGLSLVLLGGCADNPYAKTYQPSSEIVLRSVAQRRAQPIPNTPELVKGTDPNKDLAGLCSEGYVVIGQSKFRGSTPNEADAIAQSKAVGADRVLVYKGLASTEHDAVPATLPSKLASVANDTTTPFGPNGAAIIAGSATTATFGAEPTRNAPTIVRYDTLAFFLVKVRPSCGPMTQSTVRLPLSRPFTSNSIAISSDIFAAGIISTRVS
jgi:hypothetical protein